MRTKMIAIAGLFSLLFAFMAKADIVRSQLTSAIENREPTDDLASDVVGRANSITRVFYFNQLTNMNGDVLEHKWLLDGVEKAVVQLPIGSDNWRTYSSKRMNDAMQGNWQIQVWLNGQQLQSHEFTYRVFQ